MLKTTLMKRLENKKLVKIEGDNLLAHYIDHLYKQLEGFKSIEGLIGITLNGGLSRGYGDALSEVDVTLYFDSIHYERINNGDLQVTEGICVIDGVLYDIKLINFEVYSQSTLSIETELWDLSYAEILHDPQGLLQDFFREQLKNKVTHEAIGGIMFDAFWHYKLAGDIWIYRKDIVQGHMMMNQAANSLVKALYIANSAYIPHEKWLVHMIHTLNWLPCNKDKMLSLLYNTGDMTLKSLLDRQKAIEVTWHMINDYVVEQNDLNPSLDVTKQRLYKKIKQLLEHDSYSLEAYKEIDALRNLSSDPKAKFVYLRNGQVVVDKDKLLALKPDSMYTWHYDIVRIIQSELG